MENNCANCIYSLPNVIDENVVYGCNNPEFIDDLNPNKNDNYSYEKLNQISSVSMMFKYIFSHKEYLEIKQKGRSVKFNKDFCCNLHTLPIDNKKKDL